MKCLSNKLIQSALQNKHGIKIGLETNAHQLQEDICQILHVKFALKSL